MNWPERPLQDFCRPKQWPTITQNDLDPSGYPVYGANGQIGWYSGYNHEHATVLITCRGATCGVINIAPPKSYVTGNAMALDDLNDSVVDLRYLAYALTPDRLRRAITGSAQPQITRESLRGVTVPLPPLHEQRRIAAILDHADALRTKRESALSKFDALAAAMFYDKFGDPISNQKSWPMYRFEDQIVSLQYGPRFYNESYSPEGTRIVRITDLDRHGHLDFESMPLMEVSDSDRGKFSLTPGDIVFARTGATVGKLALIGPDDPPCIAGAYFIRIRVREGIEPLYAATLLRTKSIQSIIVAGSHQSAQQNFSGPGLRSLPFPLPPLPLQQRFTAAMASLAERERALRRATAVLDELFASLQSRAFRGEL